MTSEPSTTNKLRIPHAPNQWKTHISIPRIGDIRDSSRPTPYVNIHCPQQATKYLKIIQYITVDDRMSIWDYFFDPARGGPQSRMRNERSRFHHHCLQSAPRASRSVLKSPKRSTNLSFQESAARASGALHEPPRHSTSLRSAPQAREGRTILLQLAVMFSIVAVLLKE